MEAIKKDMETIKKDFSNKCVECITQEQFVEVLKWHEKKGHRWSDDDLPMGGISEWSEIYCCLDLCDEFNIADKIHQEKSGFTVLSFEQFKNECYESKTDKEDTECIKENTEFTKEVKKLSTIIIYTAILLLAIGMSAVLVTQDRVIDKQNKVIDNQKEIIDDSYNKIRELQYQAFERDSLIMELESEGV